MTESPWFLVRDPDLQGERYPYARRLVGGGRTLMCDARYTAWVPDDDEDWSLIAAAPDLLDALTTLRQGLGCWCRHETGALEDDGPHTAACRAAQAALRRVGKRTFV